MRVMSILKTVWTWALVRLESTMRWAMMVRILTWERARRAAGRERLAAAGLAAAGPARPLRAGAEQALVRPWLHRLLHVGEDVFLGDAATGAGAGDLAQVEIVVFGDLADQRRGADMLGRMRELRRSKCRLARLPALGQVPRGLGQRRRWRELPGGAADHGDDGVDLDGVPASGTLISVRTPAAGEGISASTLSVEISKSGSSRSTLSPTCLSHLVMVPSKMDSPICGMMTSVRRSGSCGSGARLGLAAAEQRPGQSQVLAAGFGCRRRQRARRRRAEPASSMTATTVLICTVGRRRP